MAFGHGSKAYLKIGDLDASPYAESSDLGFDVDSDDIKVYSATWVQRVFGIISSALNAALAYDPTADAAIWTAMTSGEDVPWEWGPQGNGAGAVKYSGSMQLSSNRIAAPSTGKVTQSIVCQPTGTISKGTFGG
jgi:hypothetical protein